MTLAGIGLVIHTDGSVVEDQFTMPIALRELYDTIGCKYVDALRLRSDLSMFLDDEGMAAGTPNPLAEFLVESITGRQLGQHLYGTAILLGLKDSETIGLDPAQVETLDDRILIYRNH